MGRSHRQRHMSAGWLVAALRHGPRSATRTTVAVLRDTVLSACPDAEFIMEGSVGSVIGVHIGPQASALMFVPE